MLNLRVNDTKVTRELEITSINIHVGESKLIFDPYFSFKNNVLKFFYLNVEQEHCQLYIYNGDELVFREKIGKDFTIQNVFDLSKLESGNYKVVLSSRNNDYAFGLVK